MKHEEAVVDERKKNKEVGECRPLLRLAIITDYGNNQQRKHSVIIHTGKGGGGKS
jgi:hypothetical protein